MAIKAELKEKIYCLEDGSREARIHFVSNGSHWSFDRCDFNLDGRKMKYGYGDWKFLGLLASEIQRIQEESKGDVNGTV